MAREMSKSKPNLVDLEATLFGLTYTWLAASRVHFRGHQSETDSLKNHLVKSSLW